MLFFFNDTATTEIFTLSLHDALPIFDRCGGGECQPGAEHALRPGARPRAGGHPGGDALGAGGASGRRRPGRPGGAADRKSTRLNSSHANISYAVFCLKKKNNDELDYV